MALPQRVVIAQQGACEVLPERVRHIARADHAFPLLNFSEHPLKWAKAHFAAPARLAQGSAALQQGCAGPRHVACRVRRLEPSQPTVLSDRRGLSPDTRIR